MSLADSVAIPYGGYWSTPFVRWQADFAHLHALSFAAYVAKNELAKRSLAATAFDFAVLGTTVPQYKSFWGVPWMMTQIGAPNIGGPTLAQACATSARCLSAAAGEIMLGGANASLVLTADRTSNGPLVTYPDPNAMGGAPKTEHWLLDNFAADPATDMSMVKTAENCAGDWKISTQEQHDVVAQRYQQYKSATASDHAFQRRYMTLPFDIPDAKFRKIVGKIDGDIGIHDTNAEALAKLKPVMPDGTVTYGGQTHPADGNAAMIMARPALAREMSSRPEIDIRILGFGQARERPAYMPAAPVPASRRALDNAGIDIGKVDAVKTHNPFVVNDIVFARETGFDVAKMNNYGCSLVYGHPQGPTGLRLIIELIEELVERGGGIGLFNGCAAGDTGMALVLKVSDSRQ
jgi:acetyl-CoA acetyltransferase